jgi:hypothetical protein
MNLRILSIGLSVAIVVLAYGLAWRLAHPAPVFNLMHK